MLLKKKAEHILDYKFEYTYDGKYKSNGDLYTTILFNDVLATYIIDFDAERLHGRKYTPEYLIENQRCLAEVLLFNKDELLDDEVYEILIFNEHHKIPVSILGLDWGHHCTSAPAKFNYVMDWKSQTYNMEDKEYYIKGKEYSKDDWDIIKRSMKINKVKQKLNDTINDR